MKQADLRTAVAQGDNIVVNNTNKYKKSSKMLHKVKLPLFNRNVEI